jgi:hypothetical protein
MLAVGHTVKVPDQMGTHKAEQFTPELKWLWQGDPSYFWLPFPRGKGLGVRLPDTRKKSAELGIRTLTRRIEDDASAVCQ